MKKILTVVALILSVIVAHSQIIENGEGNPMWGIRATFDVNMPGKVHNNFINDKTFRAGTGGAIGAVCNVYLGKKFYLESAISLFYDTYSYKDLVITDVNFYEESDPLVYKIGLRIPVVVGYSISITDQISVAPYTGPELSYAFAGDIKIHDRDRLDANDFSLFGNPGFQRRVECGWKIGLAFFTGMWSFNIDGTIGMTNLMTNGMKFRENRGTVSAIRYF